MILAIASGKGGTGKTTLSVNLAKVWGGAVQLLDCDVEEPNCHLFLKGQPITTEPVNVPIPVVNERLCRACGLCSAFCQYHAIVCLKTAPMIFPELCHGCGGCIRVCPQRALCEEQRRVGEIQTIQEDNIRLIQGCLDVGVAMAPPVIRAVKAKMERDIPAILDAPPGTSCPVVTTLKDSDFAVLVTEPTPFGLHDLTLAVDMILELGVAFGVVINRVGIGDERVQTYCQSKNIPILLEIPDDRRIAEAYSRGILMVDAFPEYRGRLEELKETIRTLQEVRGVAHANL